MLEVKFGKEWRSVKIGITGGSSLIELGDREEVASFFGRVREVSAECAGDVSLISDRLYRRYLRPGELAAAAGVVEEVIKRLERRATGKEREFLERLKRAFQKCAESAAVNFETFRDTEGYTYEPVRLVIAELPWFALEKQRTLAEYESLSDAPFWAQAN